MSAPHRAAPEHRAHPRRHIQIEVTMMSESQLYTGLSENLSEGGVFVATHALRPIGEKIDLTLVLPNAKPIRMLGEVRWVREFSDRVEAPPGMGLRFVSLTDEVSAAIRAFLERRSPLFFEE
jgi:uncharacterized protein (TIGR02266 family)